MENSIESPKLRFFTLALNELHGVFVSKLKLRALQAKKTLERGSEAVQGRKLE